MAATTVDLNTLKTIMALIKPEPVAPVAPIAPLYTNIIDERISMAKDISYMQADIREIKGSIKDIADNHISKTEFAEHINVDTTAHANINKDLADHETRLRMTEKGLTQVMVWGSALFILLGVLETIVLRFWK